MHAVLVATVTPFPLSALENNATPVKIFREVLRKFVKSEFELDMAVSAPEKFRVHIPDMPFGLCKNFWSDIMCCLGTSMQYSRKYSLMLFQDQFLDTYRGFFDYFTAFGELLNAHLSGNDKVIDYLSFCEIVKKSIPLLIGSKLISLYIFFFVINNTLYK